MSERTNETYFKEITKLEALLAEKEAELDALQSKYKQDQDTSQQKYAELQATSQQQIDKLQREIVDVTAQKKKYKERLDEFTSFSQSFTQSFTPDKPEAKALAENGSDDAEERPVGGIAASFVASPPAAVHAPNPVAVLDTSLQNKHFNISGEGEVENEPSALKKSEEVAGDEDSEEDTSSPLASLSKKSDEDVLQDDSDKTASPKNSDDEAEELDENELGAKEGEKDKDVEEDAKEDVEEDEEDDEEDDDGKNVELPPIAENQPVEAEELELLSTPVKKSIEYKSDEDGFVTASEDNAASSTRTTRDAESQTRSLRKSKRRSKTSPKKTSSSAKKQKRPVRNQ